MTEILFYHLTQTPLEQTLPVMLERALERGQRVLITGSIQARLEALDTTLWTYREDSFLPHGLEGRSADADQPVLLSRSGTNANDANVLILIDGAGVPAAGVGDYARVALLFDGHDPQALTSARAEWKRVVAADHTAVYWAQEDGRWVEKARSG